jgi:hypothetical protein
VVSTGKRDDFCKRVCGQRDMYMTTFAHKPMAMMVKMTFVYRSNIGNLTDRLGYYERANPLLEDWERC